MRDNTLSIEINGRKIGPNNPTYFIADIGANHDGDIERAKKLIYMAAESGAEAAKFQHFDARTIVSDYGFKSLGLKMSHQAAWGKSVYEVYKDASLNIDWTETLREACVESGISFMTSPYSFNIVDAVDAYVHAYKIGSGEITWLALIKYIALKNKPYILATGASDMSDVERAVIECIKINSKLCLMQCNTNYTGSVENYKYINLNVLKNYSRLFPNVLLGLSDHTQGHATVLGAITLGACMIEKHFTDDVSRSGPDHKFAMDPSSWLNMVERSRELEISLGSDVKRIEDNEQETAILQRRSIRASKKLKKGSLLNYEDLDFLRPCPTDAIPPYDVNKLVGKKLNIDISEGENITWKAIE